MTNSIRTSISLAAFAFAVGACASAPDAPPRLLVAEASLKAAEANPGTLESGRAPLEKANAALLAARDDLSRGKEDAYIHNLRMGEGYIDLAETRGAQSAANARIAALNTERAEVVSAARSREVAVAEAATDVAKAETVAAENRADRSETVAANAVADTAAAEARAAVLVAELTAYEQKQTELGLTLILRDLQFSSGSAVLTSGAQGRLQPLAAYLAKQPDARIQIAGHTDSQGAEAYNQDLSAKRAQSTGAYLVSTGIDAGRVTSVGFGESVPLSANDTAAGRAINRRVEITILD